MNDSSPGPVRLDQFLQLAGLVGTGGQAKVLVQSGAVTVDGEVETRRRKKLSPGQTVSLGEARAVVGADGRPVES